MRRLRLESTTNREKGEYVAKVDFQSKPSTLHGMAIKLGLFSAMNPWKVLIFTGVLTAFLLPFAVQPAYDDDVVKFLPEGDPEVDRFMEIGTRFEGLAVGIIGIEPREGDIFTQSTLTLMRTLSDELPELEGVGFATSITTIPDIAEAQSEDGESMTDLRDMIGPIPPAGDTSLKPFLDDIRSRVLSRDHIRGALVSETGDAAMVLVTFLPDAPVKPTAEAIEAAVQTAREKTTQEVTVHLGGAPFIGAFVAGEARKDIGRLSPWVSLAVILILLLTARSIPGTLIALSSVGVSICWLIGLMGLMNSPLTLVSSSLPVLLVALGSAYSIHVLTQILSRLDHTDGDTSKAIPDAIHYVAPPVLVAGLTTALAFLSFLVMDIAPMRTFGLWMAGGTLLAVFLALTLVPAACTLFPLKARSGGRAPVWATRSLEWLASTIAGSPRISTVAVLVIVTMASIYTAKVDTHMETRAFFEEDSAPVRAEDFLEEKLGGSLFLQVEIKGDIRSPLVLKQIERFEDAAAAEEGVTGVQSIASTMRLINMALSGEQSLPHERKRAVSLAALSRTSDPSLKLLVDENWEHALVPVKLGGFNTERAGVLAEKLSAVSKTLSGPRITVSRQNLTPEQQEIELQEVTTQVHHILKRHDQTIPRADIFKTLRDGLDATDSTDDSLKAAVHKELNGLIGATDDPYLYLREGANWESIVAPCSRQLSLGTLDTAALEELLKGMADPEELEDMEAFREALAAIMEYLDDAASKAKTNALGDTLKSLLGEQASERIVADVTRAITPLLETTAFLPHTAEGKHSGEESSLEVAVSGYPMIYSGMNRSVYNNQTRSMLLSCGLVLLALAWFFRNGWLALAASIPAGITLLVTFGVMGMYDIPMDVGTSMIASIALGVGIDYAVHLVWKYGIPERGKENETLHETLESTGWGIVINALEVTVGFGLLAMGTVVPMQNFGLLTALAMMVSALATLGLIPLLVRGVTAVSKG